MVKDLLESASSVVEMSFMWDVELEWATNRGTSWYRSKERKTGGRIPFASYLLNKKWTMEEEFNNHMLRFNQVTMSSIYFSKLHFDIPGWIDSH